MKVLLPSERVMAFVRERGLLKKFTKQVAFLSADLTYPSLRVERLEPKSAGLYSFRVDKQYRGIFFFDEVEGAIRIVDVNNHYR